MTKAKETAVLTNSLYVASIEPNSGSFSICLGLMELLKQNFNKVAFFKPIAQGIDSDCLTMIEKYDLDQGYKESIGYEKDEFLKLIANDSKGVMQELIQKYELLQQNHDFVLVLGISTELVSKAIEYDINYEISKNFSSPFVAVLNAKNKSSQESVSELRYALNDSKKHGCNPYATFINMVQSSQKLRLQKQLEDFEEVYTISYEPLLQKLSLSEIQASLRAKQLYGQRRGLKKLVQSQQLVSATLEQFIKDAKDEVLVVTDRSRFDIVLGVIALHYSQTSSAPAGVILCGEAEFSSEVDAVIRGYEDLQLPILTIDMAVEDVVQKLKSLRPTLGIKNRQKIQRAIELFFDSVDSLHLQKRLLHSHSDIITPLKFSYMLTLKAKERIKKIVLVESEDERILKAAAAITQRGVAKIILIGKDKQIKHKASMLGIKLRSVDIIDPLSYVSIGLMAQNLYEKRKEKGMTYDQALDLLQTNYTYFATMLVQQGLADGMVSGAVNSTADTIRPALQVIKTKPGVNTVSSVFFICLDTKVLVYGDCAINKEPNPQQLADIAISSAQTAKSFFIDPKVAMLAYSSGDSGSGETIQKVKEATQIVQQKQPDLEIEGPIQYDAAIDVEIAKKKLPHSKVAGHASVFIFPDLNSGNNTYKAVQRATNAIAIGPILQGLNSPINDLSRGCSVEDIINTITITAIQARKR